MNLKNRIEKLEVGLVARADTGDCNCPSVSKFEVVVWRPEHSETERQRLLVEAEMPQDCSICSKPIVRQIVIVHGIWDPNDPRVKAIQ